MKGYTCVTSLVHHIFLSTAESFKGTRFEHSFVVFHDALSLMTAITTQAWMKTQTIGARSYLDIWLLPKAGLLVHTQRYKTSFPGNHPEWCPWDNALNKDAHDEVIIHCVRTQKLCTSDPHKFMRSSPKLQTSAYLRLLNPHLGSEGGVPSGQRICEDVGKFIGAVEAVVASRGTVVESQTGHRVRKGGAHGGARIKLLHHHVRKWVHPDAREAMDQLATISSAFSITEEALTNAVEELLVNVIHDHDVEKDIDVPLQVPEVPEEQETEDNELEDGPVEQVTQCSTCMKYREIGEAEYGSEFVFTCELVGSSCAVMCDGCHQSRCVCVYWCCGFHDCTCEQVNEPPVQRALNPEFDEAQTLLPCTRWLCHRYPQRKRQSSIISL